MSNTVVAIVEDLFFHVKIAAAAKQAGLKTIFVTNAESAMEQLAQRPMLAVLDLNFTAIDPVPLISRIKAELPEVPLVGYVSHVQTQLRQSAADAGCDIVLARSAFAANFPQILQRYA